MFNKISIIVPVYNEEKYIEEVVNKLISLKLIKEIIVINDGSTDNTLKILKKYKNIILINNNKNRGKGYAIKMGVEKSTGDIVLIQDADLEYNPDNYPTLLEPFNLEMADVVYGSRLVSNRPHRVLYFWHYLGNQVLTIFSNILTNLNLTDMETGYKVFRGDLIRKIAPKLECDDFGFEPEITAKISKIKDLRIYEVGISYWGRTYAEGKKIGWRDGVKTVWYIIKFNILP